MDTKLHEAVRYCDVDGVLAALKENFDPNSLGVLKWTPVQEASRAGERDILFHLLAHGGDPNMRDGLSSCNTSLHFAAEGGHIDCLRLLLQHKGNATLLNAEGKTCQQVAPPAMRQAVAELVMEFGGEGKEEELNNNDRKLIRRPAPTDRDKWNALPEVPKRAEMGYLHLSFEYHRGVLKVRVWQISDLLLPPPQISMIHSIFVRGYFIPDKVRKTNRRTEEIIVDMPERSGTETPKTGIQHIFTASSYRFRTPLLYTGVTEEFVKTRSLQIEVCMTQKHTHRTFLMAMVHMPLRTAVRRPIRQKYPLIPCLNITTPNNMRVYSATDLQLESSKGDHSKVNSGVASPEKGQGADVVPVTARDVDLEDVVSMSGEDFMQSHLTLCLSGDDDSDDDDDYNNSSLGRSGDERLQQVRATNGVSNGVSSSGGSSTTTLNIPSSGEEGDEDDDYDDFDDDDDSYTPREVVVHADDHEQCSTRSTPVNFSARSTPVNFSARSTPVNFSARSTPVNVSARSTPMDATFVDMHNSSVLCSGAKKKIIPNELLQDISQDVVVEMPKEETVVQVDMLQASETQPRESAFTPTPASSGVNAENVGRRKIIPVEAKSPQCTSDKTVNNLSDVVTESNSLSKGETQDPLHFQQLDNHSEPAVYESPKKKKVVVPENISIPSDSLPEGSTLTTAPTKHSSIDSEGLSPRGGITSELSPATPDSAFSPASRPETPCWDFYDFSEDMPMPEEDVEATSRALEANLSQLRLQDVGSWQNLTKEPILPMVLVDDFDTLTADGEEAAGLE